MKIIYNYSMQLANIYTIYMHIRQVKMLNIYSMQLTNIYNIYNKHAQQAGVNYIY